MYPGYTMYVYEPAVTKMMGSSTNDTAGNILRDKTDMVGLRKFAMRQLSSDDIGIFCNVFFSRTASVLLLQCMWVGLELNLDRYLCTYIYMCDSQGAMGGV